MTTETTSGDDRIYDADAHDQETKKSYYHAFDDVTVEKMKHYFNVNPADQEALLRYLKSNSVPATSPNDV